MPRAKSNLWCPICKSTGGSLAKRQVKKAVYLPKLKDTKTVSQAWDYAAKVCLRLHKAIIRLPPESQQDDNILSDAIYEHFAKLLGNIHSSEEIHQFESRQFERLLKLKNSMELKEKSKVVKQDKGVQENEEAYMEDNSGWKDPYEETLHFPLPSNTGSVTKFSIALLYAVVVCKTLSDYFQEFPYSKDAAYICAIYTNFYLDSRCCDLRSRKSWMQWMKIYGSVLDHGYNAASSLNAVVLDSEDRKSKVRVGLSVKHIRKMQSKIEQLIKDIVDYLPLYSELVDTNSEIIKNNIIDTEGNRHNFIINEHLLNSGELERYNYYFIKHYDSSKRSKIRWCPISFKNLAHVSMFDYRYIQFENMIKYYSGLISNDSNSHSISERYRKLETLLYSAYRLLQETGFKKTHMSDKIKSNILYFIDNSNKFATK
jgi:hypothetical protein